MGDEEGVQEESIIGDHFTEKVTFELNLKDYLYINQLVQGRKKAWRCEDVYLEYRKQLSVTGS